MHVLGARLTSAQDAVLARLIKSSSKPMHLVCDVSHRLLAFSESRGVEFGPDAQALLGHSLWQYATEEIVEAEEQVRRQGWNAQNGSVQFCTGHNHSSVVPIYDSLCTWTRLTLSDGTFARLVETECVPKGERSTHILCVDEHEPQLLECKKSEG